MDSKLHLENFLIFCVKGVAAMMVIRLMAGLLALDLPTVSDLDVGIVLFYLLREIRDGCEWILRLLFSAGGFDRVERLLIRSGFRAVFIGDYDIRLMAFLNFRSDVLFHWQGFCAVLEYWL